MTAIERGSIVLVRFVFADESGWKQRPVLVVSSGEYHAERREVIVAAITSNTQRLLAGDAAVEDWQTAGLRLPSVITGILRTIRREMIVKHLGALSAVELQRTNDRLRFCLNL